MLIKQKLFNSPLKSSIILYLIIIFILIIIKPPFLFDSSGKAKYFGVGVENKTIFPIWLICIFIAILSYYLIILLINVY